jgi:ADP-heptose:LPS heptosyltransferase
MQEKNINNYYRKPYYVKNFFLYLYLRIVDTILIFITSKKINRIPPKKIKKILVSNIGHLGDVLYTLQIIHLIKQDYPNITIDFIGNGSTKTFALLCPHISKFYIFDHWMLNRNIISLYKKYKNHFFDFMQLRKTFRKNSYDLAIDFYPYYPNSLALLSISNIPFISGYSSGGFSSILNINEYFYSNNSILDMNLKLFKKTFASNKSYKPYLKLTLDPINLKKILNDNNLYILVQPCSGKVFREWPLSNWVSLCTKLNSIGFACVFVGRGEREYKVCKNIYQNLDNNKLNINLCNKLVLKSYISLVKKINYFIGSESFGAHLSNTFKKKTFMIKTGTTVDEQWGILEKNSQIIRSKTDCYPCFKKNGCIDMKCIKDISPLYVFNQIVKKSVDKR